MTRKEPRTRKLIQPIRYGEMSDVQTRETRAHEAFLRRTTVGQFLEQEASRKRAGSLLRRLREKPLHEQQSFSSTQLRNSIGADTTVTAIPAAMHYAKRIPVTYVEDSDSLFSRNGFRNAILAMRTAIAFGWATIIQMFDREHSSERSAARATFIKAGATATILVFGGVWFYQHLPGLVQQVAGDTDISTSIPSTSPATYTVSQPLLNSTSSAVPTSSAAGSLTPTNQSGGQNRASSGQQPSVQSSGTDPTVSNGDTTASVDPASGTGSASTGGRGGGEPSSTDTGSESPLDPVTGTITDILNTVPKLLP